MANSDSLSQSTGYNVGRFLVAYAQGVSVGAQANAAASLPLMSGGLTNGGATANSGGVIIRQVTFQNPSGNLATANVGILTSNDGNTSNAVVSVFKLSNVSAAGTFQDGNIATTYVSTALSGATTQALFAYVSSAGATTGTIDIKVYGDVVNF